MMRALGWDVPEKTLSLKIKQENRSDMQLIFAKHAMKESATIKKISEAAKNQLIFCLLMSL